MTKPIKKRIAFSRKKKGDQRVNYYNSCNCFKVHFFMGPFLCKIKKSFLVTVGYLETVTYRRFENNSDIANLKWRIQ